MLGLAKRALEHFKNKTTDQAEGIMSNPIEAYVNPDRYENEIARIYKTLPLALCLSSEISNPKSHRAMNVIDTPVLITRGKDMKARAFLNVCRHRGSKVCEEERGEKLILNGMARDYFQRENLQKGIEAANDNDLILISDLDEIPNLNNLNFTKINNNVIIFEQKMFYYKLNLFYEDFKWQGTKGVKFKNFISPQWLRNIKGKKYPKWRVDTWFSKKKYSNLFYIKNGGWHFTCLRTAEELEKKLLNFAHHYEYEKSGIKINDLKK